MLKALRNKKTAKKVWIGLAIIILPAFVLWGSGSLVRSRHEEAYAGRIFGRNISTLELKDAYDAEKTAAILQYGDELPEAEQRLNLESRAWERLILLFEARKRNITATDQEVIALVQSYPFSQRNGTFDKKSYEETVQYVFRAQTRVFEEQIRQNIILSKLYDQATGNTSATEEEIKKEYERSNEEMSVYYIAALPSEFSKDISPSEEDIKGYFINNPLSFKQPVSFNMDYITVDSEDTAKQVMQRLYKREDFRKVAGEIGAVVKETGLFAQTDPIPGIGWSAEISNFISKLKVGQYTPAIHADKKYYLLMLKERKETYIPEFEDIKDKAKEMYIKEEAGKRAQKKLEECLEKMRALQQQKPKQADFNKVAKDFGLKSDATSLFKFGSYIEGIGASDKLWLAGKDLKDDEISDIISLEPGFFIIKIKSRALIDEKKFADEKEEFSRKLVSLKKQTAFLKFLDELKRRAQ